MKIIQTFWTKPMFDSFQQVENRNKGGWLSQEYNIGSWCLSCLNLCKLYNQVELYTDSLGYQILIEELHLPYTKVHVCLDGFSKCVPSTMWALAKIYVYSLQNEPFLHIDGDVYLWNKLQVECETSDVVVQNIEGTESFNYYNEALSVWYEMGIPIYGLFNRVEKKQFKSINAGVFGGSDFVFIRKYAQQMLNVYKENESCFCSSSSALLNVVLEQLSFIRLAEREGKNIFPIFKNVSSDFSELIRFETVMYNSGYIHLVGSAKSSVWGCNLMINHLKMTYPNVYTAVHERYHQANECNDEVYFENSKQIYNEFANDQHSIKETIRQIISKELDRWLLYKSIWKFENAIYRHRNDGNFSDGTFIRFLAVNSILCKPGFCYKDLLSYNYTLTFGIELFLSKYPLDVLKSPQSVSDCNNSIKEVLILIKKEQKVKTIQLDLMGSLLLLFDGNVLSGMDIYNRLREYMNTSILDDVVIQTTINFIIKHILYTNYLTIV